MSAGTKSRPDNRDNVPLDPGAEAWRNDTEGTVCIVRLAEYGRRVSDLVQGGQTFVVTPQERRLNQNGAARRELDMFTNGTLVPITLLDDDPDTPVLQANPNLITDDEMPELLKLRGDAFVERLAQITSPAVMERLFKFVKDPQLDVTVDQLEQLRARQKELQPTFDEPEETERRPRRVTPK